MASTYSTYRFGGCGLPIICGDRKYSLNNGIVAYCRLGNAWRATVVAILPDYCHPSSFSKYNSAKNEPTLIILVQESEEIPHQKVTKLSISTSVSSVPWKIQNTYFQQQVVWNVRSCNWTRSVAVLRTHRMIWYTPVATKRVPAIFCARIQLSTVRKVKD